MLRSPLKASLMRRIHYSKAESCLQERSVKTAAAGQENGGCARLEDCGSDGAFGRKRERSAGNGQNDGRERGKRLQFLNICAVIQTAAVL